LLEKLNFRIYVLPEVTKRSDTHQVELFWYAHQLFHNNYPFGDPIKYFDKDTVKTKQQLENKMRSFIFEKCDLKNFVEALTLDRTESYDYYHWNGLKYFLANYEIYLRKYTTESLSGLLENKGKEPDDILHREHIWATDNPRGKTKHNKDIHEKCRLGNFALLEGGINSKVGKEDIWDKINLYNDRDRPSRIQMISNITKYYEFASKTDLLKNRNKSPNWYIDLYKIIFDYRETKMINYAISRWGLEDELDYKVRIDSFVESSSEQIFSFSPKYQKK